jgi:hypothetical protein
MIGSGFGGGARSTWFGVILCVLVLSMLAVSSSSFGDDPVAESNRIGTLVFVSYLGQTPLVLSPTQMRMLGSELLGAELEARGHEVVSYPELESLMLEWRVRSDRNLGLGFLGALANRHAVDRVLVATLVVYPDRLVVLSRGLETTSGWLVSATVVEELSGDLWGDPGQALENWRDVVGRASLTLADRWNGRTSEGSSGTLVVLPVTPIGINRGQSDMATYCLLGSVLEAKHWSVPDPSLVVSTLLKEGFTPRPLETEARRELASRFSAKVLLIPSLLSFGEEKALSPSAVYEDDFENEIPHQLETTVPVYLSLLVVDSTTGNVISGGGEYLAPENPQGLFGIPNDIRVATRLRKGTDRLVRIIPKKEEDS